MALVARLPVPVEAAPTVRKVVLTDRYLVTATVTGWVAVLDLRALREEGDADQSKYLKIFQTERLWDLDCRDDTIAFAHENHTVTLWDAQTGLKKADLLGHVNLVKCVVLPPNQQTVISGGRDTSIAIWDAQSHKRLATLTGHRERIIMLQVFDDFLISGSSDGGVRVWNLTTNSCIHTLEGHDSGVMYCGMNENRTLLATGGVKGEVKIWNVKDGALVTTCQGHTTVPIQFSNALGNVLLTAAPEGSIRSWDWATGTSLRTFDAHQGGRGFVWTEKFLITAGMDGKLCVWDRESWEYRFDMREPVSDVYHVVRKGNLLAAALLLDTKSSLIELWDLTKLEERVERKVE